MEGEGRTVVVLGASDNGDRYSYKAMARLLEKKYRAIPVNPRLKSVLGVPARSSLADIDEKVDTLSVYLSPAHSTALIKEIMELRPKRVIFNPGAENPEAERKLDAEGIPWMRACTLVLLSTGQF